MSQGCCCFWSIICLLPNLAKSKFWPNFQISFWESWKRNSILWKYRQRAFIWVAMHAQHRILSADSKVTFTLQNSIKHSGSERVKSQIFSWVRNITKISSKYHQAALPITIFWVIFAVIAIKKKKNFRKLGQRCLNPCSPLGSSLPSFVTDERERFQSLNIVYKITKLDHYIDASSGISI